MMLIPDIPRFKLDLEGNSKFNAIPKEYGKRSNEKNNEIFVPQYAPFYINSFKMYFKTGEPMVLGEDYEFYGIMSKLTEYTAKPVGLFVKLLKPEITEWYSSYQVVGNFNKVNDDIILMLKAIAEDDRTVDWNNIDGKPEWYNPKLHQHDLTYEIFGFTDLINAWEMLIDKDILGKGNLTMMLESFEEKLDVYINGFRQQTVKLLERHKANKTDAHGVQKDQIGLDKLDNFKTASLSETVDGKTTERHITVYNAAKVATMMTGQNARLLDSGKLPIFTFPSDPADPVVTKSIVPGEYVLYCKAVPMCVVGGKRYSVPEAVIDITDTISNPVNKTLYFYLNYKSGSVNYVITEIETQETASNGLVALLTCNANGIDALYSYNRFTMDGLGIVPQRQGNIIPATSGSLYTQNDASDIFNKSTDLLPE
ncbi:hypothetical protein PS1_0135 [Aeromonas phage PS1]|uniref:Uncharacterized protein n=1 Tax=Aeromonas phage PS1 TaxID=2591406 RepID=A0A514TV47_9CAUD|nr:virion structural protein [Aeromonas phage PS1]QDJ96894.1 hypothetical protein PS1_0135 [Aeromonas phage PS1]